MKILKSTLIVLTLAAASQLHAGNETLVTSIKKQQKLAEKEIVDLWSTNNRDNQLESVLEDYVIREIRLRSITGTTKTGSLLSRVLVKGKNVSYSDSKQLARKLVLEHMRSKGLQVEKPFVNGPYTIVDAEDMKVAAK